MTWALRSPCRPSRRAHLLTTGQGLMAVLPNGSHAPAGGGSAGYIPAHCLPLLSASVIFLTIENDLKM